MVTEKIDQVLPDLRNTLINLSKLNSVTPPSDTRNIVSYSKELLSGIPGVEIQTIEEVSPIDNLVAHTKGHQPGKHLLLNGHLDTFEVVQPNLWRHDPFGAEIEDGKLFGVGVSDMKAGCASLIETFILLGRNPSMWSGEVTLMLVGGEEAGGKHGTQYLLETMPALRNVDACLIADVGSSRSIRFGEKGRYRFKMSAKGIPGHGAHLHKAKNAIELLIDAIVDYRERVRKLPSRCPPDIINLIKEAGPISESVAGKGETQTLLNVTSNIGVFHAGTAPNLVPGYAEVIIDSRLPIGISPDDIEETLKQLCSDRKEISFTTLMCCESLYSDPSHELLSILKSNAQKVFGLPCATTIRVGGTDGKHTRRYGINTFSCGVEGANMGAPDEYVEFSELEQCFKIHALSAFEYLKKPIGK